MTEHLEDRLKAAAESLQAGVEGHLDEQSLTAPTPGGPITPLNLGSERRAARRLLGFVGIAAAAALVAGVVIAWPDSAEPIRVAGDAAPGTDAPQVNSSQTSTPQLSLEPDAIVPAQLIGTIDTLEPPGAFAVAPSAKAVEDLEVVTGAQAERWGEPVDFEQSIVVGAIAKQPDCFAQRAEFPLSAQSLQVVLAVDDRVKCDYSAPTPPINRMYLYAVERAELPKLLGFSVSEVNAASNSITGIVADLDSSELVTHGIATPLDDPTIGADWYKAWSIGDEATDGLPTDSMELEWGCGFLTNTDGDTNVRVTTESAPNGPWTVNAIYVRSASARTPQGVGVGSTMEELVVAYRDELLIGESGWDRGDVGDLFERVPPSSYQPVVAVVNGNDTAVTFYLDGPTDDPSSRVEVVKLSAKADWGDDEGCA